MAVEAPAGTAREILVVLALALSGLLLALIAAFTPWYDAAAEPRRPAVLEMRAPAQPPVEMRTAPGGAG